MPVAFDAVGPSSAGAMSTSSPLTWAHTVSGTNTLLLVCITTAWANTPTSVTYGGTSLGAAVSALTCHASGNALFVYKMIAAPAGTANVVMTIGTGDPNFLGGSISFNGADQTTGIGTIYTTNSTGTSVSSFSTAVTSNTSGNIIAGFTGNGEHCSSATSPGTNRVTDNVSTSFASGNLSIQTTAATGSSVTVGENMAFASVYYGIIAAEVLSSAAYTPVFTKNFAGQAVQRASLW